MSMGMPALLTYLLGEIGMTWASERCGSSPCARVDDPRRFGMLLNWVVDLCEEAGQTNLLLAQQYLAGGLQKLARRPVQAAHV